MEINWEQFTDTFAGVLDSVDESLRLVSNAENGPCLFRAIKLINETNFITSRFAILLERYPAKGASISEVPYEQSFFALRDIMRNMVRSNSCKMEGLNFEIDSTESVEKQCNTLLDTPMSPFDLTYVKQFENDETIRSDSFVRTEVTLTLRKILRWSDGEYFERLNAYGLLNDTKVRHPLEKFLMSLIEAIEKLDSDIHYVKKDSVHRFSNLTSFIFYFTDRSYAVLRVPLQDTLSVAEAIRQYAELVLCAANKVGFPKEQSLVIAGKVERIKSWFDVNTSFAALYQKSITHVGLADLESTELGDFFIAGTPGCMDTFINSISALLIGCYPYFSKERVTDKNERKLRIQKYEIYRESYFDVATQLKGMIIKIKAQLGNTGSGLIKQYNLLKIERGKLEDAAEAREVVIKAMAQQRGQLSTSGQQRVSPQVRSPTPNAGDLAKRKSGGNAGLGNVIGSKSSVLTRRSPLSVSSAAATAEDKPRSRSSGDDQSPRSSNSLRGTPSPPAVEDTKKTFFGSLFSGRKKVDAAEKRRGSDVSLTLTQTGPEDVTSPRSKSAHTTPREGEEGSKDYLGQEDSIKNVRISSDTIVLK